MTPIEQAERPLLETELFPDAGVVESEVLPDHACEPQVTAPDDTTIPSAHLSGAWSVLRRGLRETPELRSGLAFTLVLALAGAAGRLVVPVLMQQIIDRGIVGGSGFRPAIVYPLCGAVAAVIVLVYLAGRMSFIRLTRAAESALCGLRVRTFAHIHNLSIAEQSETRRGTFVARVTADVDTLSQFLDWGGIHWVTSLTLMLGCVIAMLVYSVQLTLITLITVLPLVIVMRLLQRGLLGAYDRLRTRVSDALSEVSESVMGAAVIRAYGLERRTADRVDRAVRGQYDAEVGVAKYTATIFPVADLFGAIATAVVVVIGVTYGPRWGLSLGDMIAMLFLISLLLGPLGELSEVFDNTQTAIAGWRKVLSVLDLPVDVHEPSPGAQLPAGALAVRVESVDFAYRDGVEILRDIDVDIPAGAHVAIVGATGSGKTTFAKLLCRLADPSTGKVSVGGIDLRSVSPRSRRTAVRMVPQDGFLFDTTIADNVRYGLDGAGDAQIRAAFRALGLEEWVDSLPQGIDTPAGERGESLSVGERQLVALVRAQVAQPGLLILDEATSAVDPETERAIADALERISQGRTTVTIAHRLSTAQAADSVLVFDRGRIVERGTHAELVAAHGVYASLYRSWLGNTRASDSSEPEEVARVSPPRWRLE